MGLRYSGTAMETDSMGSDKGKSGAGKDFLCPSTAWPVAAVGLIGSWLAKRIFFFFAFYSVQIL